MRFTISFCSLLLLAMPTLAAGQTTSGVIYSCVDSKGNPRIVPAGTTCLKNETPLSWDEIGPQGPAGPQGSQGPAGPTIPPNVFSTVASQGFTANNDGNWHTMPNLTLNLSLTSAAPVVLSWNFSTLVGNGYFITGLVVDGVSAPGTAQVLGNVAYGHTSGTYNATLAAGAHTVTLQYKTGIAFTFDPVSFDWQTASLQALSFDLPQ